MSRRHDETKAANLAADAVNRRFGKGTTMRPNEPTTDSVGVIPTGSLGLDAALGAGGWPRGRVVELFGPEGSGKTTLALHAIASAQRQSGVAAYIDIARGLDLGYAAAIGVNAGCLYLSQPDTAEQALEIAEILARSGAMDIVVVDPANALAPRCKVEGEDDGREVLPRLLARALRKLTAVVHRTGTCLMFLTDAAELPGSAFHTRSGSTNALRLYSSLRVEVRRTGMTEEEKRRLVRAKAVKNKLAPPFKEAEFEIVRGAGIDTAMELADLAIGQGVLDRASADLPALADNAEGPRRAQLAGAIRRRPTLAATLESAVRTALGLPDMPRNIAA